MGRLALPARMKIRPDDEKDPAENHQHAAEVAHAASLEHSTGLPLSSNLLPGYGTMVPQAMRSPEFPEGSVL